MKKYLCVSVGVIILLFMMAGCNIVRVDDPSKTLDENIDSAKTGDSSTATETTTGENGSDTGVPGTPMEEQLPAIEAAKLKVPKIEYIPAMDPKNVGKSDIKAIYFTSMQYGDLDETRVFAYIGFPEGASAENPVPAVVCVHGAGGRAYSEWVKKWTDKGYAAISIDTYGNHPAGDNSEFVKDALGGPAMGAMKQGTLRVYDQWMYHAVAQSIIAANLLRNDVRVISDQIGITGISWGAHVVSNVVTFDDRFAFAIPVYGCAFLPGSAGAFGEQFEFPNAKLLWDPSEKLKDCKTPILWINSDSDKHFAVDATQKSYEAAPNSSILIIHQLNHSQNSGMNIDAIYAYANSVVRGGKPIAFPVTQPESAGNVVFNVDIPANSSNIAVTGYYLKTDIAYQNYAFSGTWEAVPGQYNNGTVNVTIPEDAKMYYVSISYKYNLLTIKSSTQLVMLKKDT